MKNTKKRVRIGIVGCGAIGSRIAKSIQKELKDFCSLSALFDIDFQKSKQLTGQLSLRDVAKKSLKELLKNSEVLVLNALRKDKHVSHFNLNEAIQLVEELKPGKAYLTHISHQLGLHDEVNKSLPSNIRCAYDGLKVVLED